jgi:hypothetical protein
MIGPIPYLSQEEIDATLPADAVEGVFCLTDQGVLAPLPPRPWQELGTAIEALLAALRTLPMDDEVRQQLIGLSLELEAAGSALAVESLAEGIKRGLALPSWARQLTVPAADGDGPALTPTEWLTSGLLLRSALEGDGAPAPEGGAR